VCHLARYEANGNVAAIEDAVGTVTRAAYNSIGQRTSVNDPNQGQWSFVYNALGEVKQQTDARGIATVMTYDVLGRPNNRSASVDVTGDGVADSVSDAWTYDPSNAKGAPAGSIRTINGATERWTGITYDGLARPTVQSVVQETGSGTQVFTQRSKYDSYYGRPVGQEFPNGEALQVLYSIYGHAVAEKDPATGTEYRRTNAVNARGQATQETFGNGVTLSASYQVQTGQLTGLTYSKAGTLRQLGYGYDVFGNVKRQSLNGGASREDYQYDTLHRLVGAMRSGAASGTVSYGYDAVGNLTKKTDFSADTASAYSYTGGTCGGGANAVKSVQLAAGGARTYCYDANGNLTGDNAGLSLSFDHQNMATKVTRGGQTDWFRYGPDGMRTRSWGADGARIYLPGYEHRTDSGETKVYVGDYAVISRIGATRKVEYLLKDRLGSVDAVVNAAGAVIETRGYDAFGKPSNGDWTDRAPSKIASTAVTPKGFTQHEHLNQLELIHMNGRVFDYALGRFTGVDPFIQFPLNSQSLNPYSYILNNPLSGTDPTGYIVDRCSAPTGSKIKSCEVITVTDESTGESASQRVNRGTLANYISKMSSASGNGAKDGFSSKGVHAPKINSSLENQYAGLGDPSSSNTMMGRAKGACNDPDIGYCSGMNDAARKLNGDISGTAEMAKEAGAVAGGVVKEEAKNPWNYVPFIAQIKLPAKLLRLFKRDDQVVGEVARIRGAQAGFSFGGSSGRAASSSDHIVLGIRDYDLEGLARSLGGGVICLTKITSNQPCWWQLIIQILDSQ